MRNRTVDDPALIRTASEWFSRLRQSPASSTEVAAWLDWYESDERNKKAYEDVQSFWVQSDALLQDAGFMERVENELQGSPSGPRRPSPRDGWASFRQRLSALLIAKPLLQAAALGAVVAAVVVLAASSREWSDPQVLKVEGPQAFGSKPSAAAPSTPGAAPELVKEAYLADGSQVALGEKSSVTVKFTKRKRYLVMSHGIAYFTVAHNPSRPFIVRVGDFYVRAVGTAFNIRANASQLVVTVTQGTVEVYPVKTSQDGEVPETNLVKAEAGKEVAWSTPERAPSVSTVNPLLALSWEKGVLQYLNEPLGSAIDDVMNYSSHPIIVRDPAIKNFLVSGTVFTNSIDAWLQSLPRLFPVEVTVDGRGNYIIESRRPIQQGAAAS